VSEPSADRLGEVIKKFRGRRLVVLGDLVADEFVYGEIARVSREAPALILEHRETTVVPGGGANAVMNLRSLGASPMPVGVVGKDENGRRLLSRFRESGISTSGVVSESGWATPTKCRIVAGGAHTRRQQIVRVDRGAPHGRLPGRLATSLRGRLKKALRRAEGILIADYGYGAGDPEIVGRPALRGARVVTVDSRMRVGSFRGVTASTPNEEEVERALGMPPLRTHRALEDAGRTLLRRTGNEAILVTRGPKGMSLFRRRKAVTHLPPYGNEEVADVTGAGDTVIAAFTLALLAGADPLEAARLANYAAGIVVTKAGIASVTRAELLRAVREDRA
jgi:rfaE bifunctional protein kinase chain/domain